MKVLFISRSYPPTLGGIEQQNYAVCNWLTTLAEVGTIVNPYGKRLLPLFLPWCVVKAILLAPRYDIILLGDGVLAVTGWILKIMYPSKPVACIVHGLDITYSNWLYQKLWLKHFIASVDRLFAVSNATANQAIERGIAETKINIIPNGVDPPAKSHGGTPKHLEKLVATDLTGKKILITVGRLVRRKGIDWFIREVMPLLSQDVVYIIAGCGPEMAAIEQSICDRKLGNRVFMLGRVSDEEKWMFLSEAHLFVQPNIKVKADMEGFGIAVLEANLAGLFVVASRLEGLCDAIADGENGNLVEPEDPQAMKELILKLLTDIPQLKALGNQANDFCQEHYCWSTISKRYHQKLVETVENSAHG